MSYDTNRCLSSCRTWISVLLALAVAFSAKAEEAASEPDAVLTLDVDSFDDAVAKHPFVLFGRILGSAGGIGSALVLFITMSVPLQLRGAGEAVFWGRLAGAEQTMPQNSSTLATTPCSFSSTLALQKARNRSVLLSEREEGVQEIR
jgi:hypothetical protein